MGKKFCFALLFLFAVTFATADSLFGFLRSDGFYVTVPNLCGQRESLMELPDWASVETAYRYNDQIPAGVVMEQTPEAGSRLKIGENQTRPLTLTISLGTEKKTIPNIIGQDARTAAAALRDHGFAVKELQVSGGTAGEVIAITPSVGTILPVGEIVTITVSQGIPTQAIAVPSLMGLSRSGALVEIFRCGLSVGDVIEEASEAPEGTVIRQSPSAGSLVSPNTKIRITISQNTT